VGLPGMRRGDPDYFPLLVGNHALGGNALVSILFREIRNKRGLSYSASSYFVPMAAEGPFVALLQTDRSQEPEALALLRETLGGFIADGPPAADLEAAKQNLIGGFPLRIDSNDKIVEYIAMIGFYDLPLDYLEQFTRQVAAVTAEDVRDAFARRVPLDGLVTVIVGRAEADEG
ncbi:MAG: insulinase family protein, partial [Gammaproteobacteria bacterium]|nr:insulinase family protein [Gammaproteobacteria bacterium]